MEEEEEEEDLEETKEEKPEPESVTFSTQEFEKMGGPDLDLFQPQVIFDLA